MDLNPFELRAWRLALGFNQKQAAAALGVQPLAYRLWEWGKRQPENARMLRLAMRAIEDERKQAA